MPAFDSHAATSTWVAPAPHDVGSSQAGTTLVAKRFTFEAAHFLPHVPEDHKCRRMHGHSYQVWVHVGGDMDERYGWIVDFGDIKTLWKRLNAQLDHHLLNEVPGLENPTAENLAAWIWQALERERVEGRAGFRVAAVEVAETVDSRALFVAPDRSPRGPGHPVVPLRADPAAPVPAAEPARPEPTNSSPSTAAPLPHCPELVDVQSRTDGRGMALDEVGVSRVRIPLEVLDRDRGRQSTVASVSMAVDLPAEVKGTHLSRFIQALRDHHEAITLFSLGELSAELRARLDARRARVDVEFPYFVHRAAPVSGELGQLAVDCTFEIIDTGRAPEHWLRVTTPVSTVCPCSRDISDYGAHNQRGHVTVQVRCANDDADLPSLVWIEELVELAESAGSSPVYPVVKRPDERHITMAAYDRPRFVEDVARDVALGLRDDTRISSFEVHVENDESIHAHNAFARVTG